MKYSVKNKFIIVWILMMMLGVDAFSQNAAQTVTKATDEINQKMDELNQLARSKKIFAAIAKLDEINKLYSREITWGTFDEKYKEAKMADPSFSFQLNTQLPDQLNPSFWADYEKRCDKIMADQSVVTDGIKSMVYLNRWDQAFAYAKQLKTTYETISGGIENLGTADIPKFAYDLYGNMNDFISNYKEIEKAKTEGQDIETYKIRFQTMIKKAERNKDLYNSYKRYIRSNQIAINDFYANVKYVNKLKSIASSGPLAKLNYADRKYNWDYGPFQKEIKEACDDFEKYDIKCPDFQKQYEDIKKSARSDWQKVLNNINASDDRDKKQEFLTYHNERWTEFLGVVKPLFDKAYNKNCGAVAEKKEETKGTPIGTVGNNRALYIKDLALGSPSGMVKLYFEPRAEVKVSFKAIWDGKWMDRVKMKILIDNSEVVDEMLEFRDNMGKFRTDFSKTIQLPSSLDNGSHTLSLVMERNPNIINKSITLSCSPRQVNFKVGEESKSPEKKVITADMFSGASAKTKAVVVPEKKTSSMSSTGASNKSSDKYWENSIPENADKEWVKTTSGYYCVRFKLNGRTVGYRYYYDANFKLPNNETLKENIALRHGASRSFSHMANSTDYFLSTIRFYRANKKTGPEASFDSDGKVRSVKYYIDDKQVSEGEYKQKARSDRSLAPYDIYQETRWKVVPQESSVPDPPQLINTDNLTYNQLSVPKNAVKYIQARYRKDPEGIEYSEFYFSKGNPQEKLGERRWDIIDGKAILIVEELTLGNKKIYRRWNRYTRELISLSLYYRPYYYKNYVRFGPGLTDNGKNKVFYDLKGKTCTLDVYRALLKKHPELPAPDIIDQLRNIPNISPNEYSDPSWADQNVANLDVAPGSKIWSVNIFEERINVDFYKDHALTGAKSWSDLKMSQPLYRRIVSDGQQTVYSISLYPNGKPKRIDVNGRIYRWGSHVDFNEDGTIKRFSYGGQTGSTLKFAELAYQQINNVPRKESYLSVSATSHMEPVQIPQSEMTPLFATFWKNGGTVSNTTMAYQPKDNPSTTNDQPDNTNTTEEADYKKLQRQEMTTLGEQINKKIEAADKAFDKPYWESGTPKTTMQATNPKQQSLDLIRQAVQIANKAKYPENKGFYSMLLAYKLLNYSGRVFGYQSKQDFFLLAAQLVNTSDQLLTKNRYIKSDLSNAYCNSAEIWREMTRKAQWGSHAYNKMECDKKVIQQYERALNIDPNNAKARKMLEQLKAPKKPVPEAVAKFEEIKPETWNEAQTLVAKLNDEKIIEEETKTEIHPLEVADMTLNTGAGKVYIMRSSTSNWEEITDSHVLIFVGDKIKTSSNAKDVSVTYTSDQAYLAIKPDAEVEFYADNKLLIRRGDAYVDVTKKGSKFLVITPTCAVGVRGTTFEVKVSPDKTTETFLYEGVVEARSGSDVGYLVPGQKVVAKKGAPKLEQTDFNAQKRLASDWNDVESMKKTHNQLKLQVAKKPAFSTTKRTSIATSNRTNVSAVSLRVSTSPTGQYHELLDKPEVEYGDALLVARCPVNVSTNTPLTVNWYMNNQTQPINVGNYQVIPGAEFFDAAIISYDAPLNPGSYRAEFVIGGRVVGRNTVKISQPKRLDAQTAQQFYVETVKALDLSLATLNQGNFGQAGQLCGDAMPLLRAALYNAPNLPDIFAVMHASQSVYALGQADVALRQSDNPRALMWVNISRGYVDRALEKCKDAQLKGALQNLQTVIGQIQSKLN